MQIDVPLGLEACSVGRGPCVQERGARLLQVRVDHAAWQCAIRSVPRHVDATVPSERELSSTDRSGGNCAARLAVDPDRRRESGAEIVRANVEEVTAGRLTREIQEVQHATRVDRRLGLDAAVWHATHENFRGGVGNVDSQGSRRYRRERSEREENDGSRGKHAPS